MICWIIFLGIFVLGSRKEMKIIKNYSWTIYKEQKKYFHEVLKN
jgi:hypothetical protein